jgi:osmotically-inducible protein OsmY
MIRTEYTFEMEPALNSLNYFTNEDNDIHNRVVQALKNQSFPNHRQLFVRVDKGVVRLEGKVLTFYEKQMCNTYVKRIPGIRELINDIIVDEHHS